MNPNISIDVKFVGSFLFLFIALYRLPVLLPPDAAYLVTIAIALVLLFPLVLIVKATRARLARLSLGRFVIFITFVSVEILAHFRAWEMGTLSGATVLKTAALVICVSTYVLFSLSCINTRAEFRFYLRCLIYGFLLFVIENLLFSLVAIGVFNTGSQYAGSAGKNVMLGAIGLDFEAIRFGLESGPKQIVPILIFLFGVSMAWLQSGPSKVFAFFVFLLCPGMIILSDSRTGAALFLVGLLLFPFLRGLNRLRIFTVLALLPVIPVILITLASIVGALPGAQLLSRSQDNNIATLSNRQIIWAEIGAEFSQVKPSIVYGYGSAGMEPSGINKRVSRIFEDGWENTGIKSAHNTILQIVIDKGLIGLVVYIVLLWSVLSRLISDRTPESFSICVGVLGLLLLSNLDAVFYFGKVESYLLLVIIGALHVSSYYDGDGYNGSVRKAGMQDMSR